MLTARAIAVAVCAFVGANALADGEAKASPTDLEWLRDEVGDGALIHHADGRIYLTELVDEADEESQGVTYPVVMRRRQPGREVGKQGLGPAHGLRRLYRGGRGWPGLARALTGER